MTDFYNSLNATKKEFLSIFKQTEELTKGRYLSDTLLGIGFILTNFR